MVFSNIFLKKSWYENHFKQIEQRSGARYQPKLNVELPINEIFNGISRSKDFYFNIRKHYGKLLRAFKYISKEYENKDLNKLYESLKGKVYLLLDSLSSVKDFNTRNINWKKINKYLKYAIDESWKLFSLIQQHLKERNKINDKYKSSIHYIHEVQAEINYFLKFSANEAAKLSNNPLLLLLGEGGSGKTHLLCDIVKCRINDKHHLYPAILLFGEHFHEKNNFWMQIIEQLNIKKKINKKATLIKFLNKAGKKYNTRTLIMIDALNETVSNKYWKANLESILKDISKYPYIGLVISIRSGFENIVLTKRLKKKFIYFEHTGFLYKEWEAVNKFFNIFSIPLPEVPILMPEFQNPLFLLLFCKAFSQRDKINKKSSKKPKHIFRGHEGATYIFENFVKNTADKIAGKFNISSGRNRNGDYFIWDTIIKKIAEKMISNNNDRISENEIKNIIKTQHPSVDYNKFIIELEKSLLISKISKYSSDFKPIGFEYKFPFQKFSDHLIVRYLFHKFYQANQKPEIYFAEKSNTGKLLLGTSSHGLIEALCIQFPERFNGKEFIEVVPYLQDTLSVQESFINSLIWRNPSAFSDKKYPKNTMEFINNKIIKTRSGFHKLLNAFISISAVPDHPLNGYFLHDWLIKFSLPERDSWWSTFLHYQLDVKDSVDRLITWANSDYDKTNICDKSILLSAIALSWFLSTSNRFIRDKATKGLVSLLKDRIYLIINLLKEFKDINDPYIHERLYAVAYGCILNNSNDKKNLESLAIYVYKNVFQSNQPPVHILLRDYARGIIEITFNRGIKLKIDANKINPPYKSNWPKRISSEKYLKKKYYKLNSSDPNDKGYLRIWSSVMYNFGTLGDFGNYVVNSHVGYWKNNCKSKDDFNLGLAQRWILNRVFELGWSPELHGEFDNQLDGYGRMGQKPERIGKKYQWIAYHELLALVSDHFKMRKNQWDEKQDELYKGPWNPYIRDIDPSFIITNDSHIDDAVSMNNWSTHYLKYNAWKKKIQDVHWLRKQNDFPKPKNFIKITDDRQEQWLLLEGMFTWEEDIPPEEKRFEFPMRELWFWIKSYIIKRQDYKKMIKWVKKQNFAGRWMPESHNFYECFIGEYPDSLVFKDLRGDFNIWTLNRNRNENSLPAPVIVTDDIYLNEFSLDSSHSDSVSVKLPCKWLINKMKLRHNNLDGRFYDRNNKLICMSTSIFNSDNLSLLLINKIKLLKFLNDNDLAIFWTVIGEKNILGEELSQKKWKGRLEMSGSFTTGFRNHITGKIKGYYRNK